LKTRKSSWVATAVVGLLALGIGSGAALATILAGFKVTGQITAISGVSGVTIDGHLYIVRAGSPAAAQLPKFSTGQTVDVYLDGPPTTSASEVIGISVHTSTTGQ
jgi:hypothetical protein